MSTAATGDCRTSRIAASRRATAVASLVVAWSFSVSVCADDVIGMELFEKKIRPILIRHCYQCHSALADEVEGGFLLDSRDMLRQGGESGPAVVPGKPAESLLIEALQHETFEMPPDVKLPDAVIADFVEWIRIGAPDPRDEPPDPQSRFQQARTAQFDQLKQWWSLQPVVKPPIPEVNSDSWSSQPIDRFILAGLEGEGLQPARRADRRTLVRRLSFVLTGLPPVPELAAEFESDEAPGAWERLVDRLLDSPHFGERWARHWMDVVRYSDSYGYEADIPAKGAWRYRDYLIRAFNADVPIDQLFREQIAGDLMENPRIDPVEKINESLIGPMFFQMGEKRNGDSLEFNGIHEEMLDNKIDAFSKAFQALTVSCARCHDHKLDPILQSEYFAIGGVLMSSRWVANTLDTPERNAEVLEQLREIKGALRQELAAMWMEELESLPEVLLASLAPSASEDHQVWREPFADETAEPPLEDFRYPWFRTVQAERQSGSLPEEWTALAKRYDEERRQRVAQNAENFTVIADFSQGLPEGWSMDGVGLRDPFTTGGDFTVALDGATAVGRILPEGLFTHALSPRLNGAVRSPFLNTFDKEYISFVHCGGDFSSHRTIADNAFLTEMQGYLKQPELGWVQLSTLPKYHDRQVYIEFSTKASNASFPPRVEFGGADAASEDQAKDPRSWFGLTRVFLHDEDKAVPADELARFRSLFDGEPPADTSAVAARYADWFRAAVRAWAREEATFDDVWLMNWLLDNGQLTNAHDLPSRPVISELVQRYREVEAMLLEPRTVNGMLDVDPGHDMALLIRGEYDQKGPTVPRGYLHAVSELLDSEPAFDCEGSGRRALADRILDPRNPLTARVFVNRVWHWLFGQGIVTTPNNFGHLGDQPSHPELLDYLAFRFVAEGWSLKSLIRDIVLTETWRQSSQSTEAGRQRDPENRLLHHYSLRRLEAEAIRDTMLAVSGRLDSRLYGPPIDPHRRQETPVKRLFSGPLDGAGRRSIYTRMTIMEPPRLLALFNQPSPKIPTGRRDVTNTPAQSLALMNDAFVRDQARHWASRLVTIEHSSPGERIERMFHAAFGRSPRAQELARWTEAVEHFAVLHEVSGGGILSNVDVWTDVAHTLFNTKEFIYVN